MPGSPTNISHARQVARWPWGTRRAVLAHVPAPICTQKSEKGLDSVLFWDGSGLWECLSVFNCHPASAARQERVGFPHPPALTQAHTCPPPSHTVRRRAARSRGLHHGFRACADRVARRPLQHALRWRRAAVWMWCKLRVQVQGDLPGDRGPVAQRGAAQHPPRQHFVRWRAEDGHHWDYRRTSRDLCARWTTFSGRCSSYLGGRSSSPARRPPSIECFGRSSGRTSGWSSTIRSATTTCACGGPAWCSYFQCRPSSRATSRMWTGHRRTGAAVAPRWGSGHTDCWAAPETGHASRWPSASPRRAGCSPSTSPSTLTVEAGRPSMIGSLSSSFSCPIPTRPSRRRRTTTNRSTQFFWLTMPQYPRRALTHSSAPMAVVWCGCLRTARTLPLLRWCPPRWRPSWPRSLLRMTWRRRAGLLCTLRVCLCFPKITVGISLRVATTWWPRCQS